MTRVIEFVGLMIMFAGGGAMDSTSLWVPLIMAFAGLGIYIGGYYLDELKNEID